MTFWRRLVPAAWIVAIVIASLQAADAHSNTFEIFRTAWWNLAGGRDLYGVNPSHRDFFDYSPSFAVLFAPFAVLPFGLGILLWNVLNAGCLYWSLGRILQPNQALVARAIVLVDTVGQTQSAQSNALCAALIILAFAELGRRRELRAALATALGVAIKIFPLAAAAFVLFRPSRAPRFGAWLVLCLAVLAALPLVAISPGELLAQYQSWFALQHTIASREFSVMDQAYFWFGIGVPYWPVQLAAVLLVVAPLFRRDARVLDAAGETNATRFHLLALASVLIFCVLFNHKAESPSFVIAVTGVAIWFAVSTHRRLAWAMLGIVVVGTVLASSDAMPFVLQRRLFEPYRLKTLPVLAVWLAIQVELWRWRPDQTSSNALPARESDRATPAT